MKKLKSLRTHYKSHELDVKHVPSNPFRLFKEWMAEAIRKKEPEPNAMTLSTSDETGRPSARLVLLKGVEKNGFTFFTNYESRKAVEIDSNPYAALTFYWSSLARQVRIEGRLQKVSKSASRRYFASRPRLSQIGAWASHQSAVLSSREELDDWFRYFTDKFRGKKVPCPDYWGGYILIPDRIEFWQGRSNRLHDRILFERQNTHWKISRLAP